MINKNKKLLSLLLSLIMIMSMFTGLEISSVAEDDILSYLTYEINDGEVTITNCDESISGDVVIPDTIEGYPVTALSIHAFAYCKEITEIIIPESVAAIGDYAFNYCNSNHKITVDENNKYFTNDESGVLFNKDKTELIRYPQGNTETEYTIPESVTTIGYASFSRCSNLTKIMIPDSVTLIEDEAFFGCSNLTTIKIPEAVTSIGFAVFALCTNLTEIILPEGLTSIGMSAFAACKNLENISIPDSVQFLGESVFAECTNLTTITIPDGITAINASLFERCSNLTEVVIPDSVTTIGMAAFENCKNIENITLPDRIVLIDNFAFAACKNLKNITIPPNTTTIGFKAFSYCTNLESITFLSTDCNFEQADIPADTIIYGYSGSTAESYASANGNIFIALEGEPPAEETTTETHNSEEESSEEITDVPEIHQHDYVGVIITDATCTDDGVMTYTCACGKTYDEVITSEGHNGVWKVVSPAEIGIDGLKDLVCTECGAILASEIIPAVEEESESDAEEVSADDESTTVEMTTKEPETTTQNPVSDKLEVSGDTIKVDNTSKVTTVKVKSSAKDILSSVKNDNVSIVDKDGKAVSGDALVGTGAKIQIKDNSGNVINTYTVCVPTDVDGNGKTTAADARLALRGSAKLEKVEGVYATASDMNSDGKITAADARKILRISAGLEKA